jgi:hypothetical protein
LRHPQYLAKPLVARLTFYGSLFQQPFIFGCFGFTAAAGQMFPREILDVFSPITFRAINVSPAAFWGVCPFWDRNVLITKRRIFKPLWFGG